MNLFFDGCDFHFEIGFFEAVLFGEEFGEVVVSEVQDVGLKLVVEAALTCDGILNGFNDGTGEGAALDFIGNAAVVWEVIFEGCDIGAVGPDHGFLLTAHPGIDGPYHVFLIVFETSKVGGGHAAEELGGHDLGLDQGSIR